MNKTIITILFVLMPFLGFSQSGNVSDLDRFQQGDTNMTTYEVMSLIFQNRDVSKLNSNQGLLEEFIQLSEDSLYIDLEKRCKEILLENPLNLSALFYYTDAQLGLGKKEYLKQSWEKTNLVYQAIERFGDGTEKEPYYVTDLNDAKALIKLYRKSGVQIDEIQGDSFVKISITTADNKKEILYFDFDKETTIRQVYFDYHRDFQYYLDESLKSKSPLNYKRLLSRFKKEDPSLKHHEIIALMIGFTNQKAYKPYINASKERELMGLVSEKSYREALKECQSFLKTNPLNFAALMEEGFSKMKIHEDRSYFPSKRSKYIVDAILWSGTGDFNHPYFVLSPIDGQTLSDYVLGFSIGIMGSGDDKNGYFLDMLDVETKKGEHFTLHFHINHATENSQFMKDLNK